MDPVVSPVVVVLVTLVFARGLMGVVEDLSAASWDGARDAGARAYRAANARYGRVRDRALARAERTPAANPKNPGWWLWLVGAGGYHAARNLQRGLQEAGEIIRGAWRRETAEGNAWKAEVLQRRRGGPARDEAGAGCKDRAEGGCTVHGVVAYRADVDPAGWLCRSHWRARRATASATPAVRSDRAGGGAPDGTELRGTPPATQTVPSGTPGGTDGTPRDRPTTELSAVSTSTPIGDPTGPPPCRGEPRPDETASGEAAENHPRPERGTPTMTMRTIEAGNVELTKQAALRLLEMANWDYEAAEQAGQAADRRITDLDNLSAELAAHGISGPLMEAVVSMSENAVKAKANAKEWIATADKDKQDANAMLAAIAQHENAADALANTQGAARDTGFYGVRH